MPDDDEAAASGIHVARVEARLRRAVFAVLDGQEHEARRLVDLALEGVPRDESGRPFLPSRALSMLRTARRYRPPAHLKRAVLGTWQGEVAESPPGDGSALALVFCHRPGYMMVPTQLIEVELAARGIEAIYLSDKSQHGFGLGMDAFAGGLEGTHDALARMVAARAPRRLLTIGASISGCMAVSTAIVLKADAALTLSPVLASSRAVREDIPRLRQADISEAVEARIGRLLDIDQWYDRYPHRPKVFVHYSVHRIVDRAQAEMASVLPNVRLRPIDSFKGHSTPWDSFARDWFGRAVDRALDKPQDQAAP